MNINKLNFLVMPFFFLQLNLAYAEKEYFSCQDPSIHGELVNKEIKLVELINKTNLQHQKLLSDFNKLQEGADRFSKEINGISDKATWLVKNRKNIQSFYRNGSFSVPIKTTISEIDATISSLPYEVKFDPSKPMSVGLERKKTASYFQSTLEKAAGIDRVLNTLTPSAVADYLTNFSSTFSSSIENASNNLVNVSNNMAKLLKETRKECARLSALASGNKIMDAISTLAYVPDRKCTYGYGLSTETDFIQNGAITTHSSYIDPKMGPNCGLNMQYDSSFKIISTKMLDKFTNQFVAQGNAGLTTMTSYNYMVSKYQRTSGNNCSLATVIKTWNSVQSTSGAPFTQSSYTFSGTIPIHQCIGSPSCTLAVLKALPMPPFSNPTITECPKEMK